ncbi:MAG TPA: TadE/TadG family type IV pilus assembly protein [Terriglobales bacterium]|nr:TadE/TadG family type IV pilus assembly protein [Terriglobales bacterium]
MFFPHHSRAKRSRGQSLVETALLIPLLLILILNAVNFGYFLLVTLNLTSATRNGIEYAIEGSSTPANAALPAAGPAATTVSYLIYQELSKLSGSSDVQVQVCSLRFGNDGAGHSNCQSCTNSGCSSSGTTTSPDPDPEPSAGFVLNSINVSYTFNTLIPTAPFNLVVGALPLCQTSGSCTFNRHAEMRAMGS